MTIKNKTKKDDKTINKRSFLKKSILLAGSTLAVGTIQAPAIASGKRRLKMVMTWPKTFSGLGTSATRLAKQIEAATEGRIYFKIYGGGELVPSMESFNATRNGTADVFHGAAYWHGKNSAFSFFTSVPFGMTQPELLGWMRWGGGEQFRDELYGRYDLKPLSAGNTGIQMGGWFRNEINSIEDLKGLKMRIRAFGGAVMKKVGVTPVGLPGGEIFQALQSGTLDAVEWIAPWNDLPMGFYKVAPYYYCPGFHEPGSNLDLIFNKKIWDSFSKGDQTLIEACCDSEYTRNVSEFSAKNGTNLDILVKKHNVKVRTFNEQIWQALANASKEAIADLVKANPDAKRVYNSYYQFQKKASDWSSISTNKYIHMRNKYFDK